MAMVMVMTMGMVLGMVMACVMAMLIMTELLRRLPILLQLLDDVNVINAFLWVCG